jgi:hypothetical protein
MALIREKQTTALMDAAIAMPLWYWFRILRYLNVFSPVCFTGTPIARYDDAIHEPPLSHAMSVNHSMVSSKQPRGSEGCTVTDDYIIPR